MLAGFEPARAEPNGLAVHRLNHSAITSFAYGVELFSYITTIYSLNNLKKIDIMY